MWISDLQEKVNQESTKPIVTNKIGTLYCGDCIDIMKQLPDKNVDMILCDLPYGVTNNKSDIIIPFRKDGLNPIAATREIHISKIKKCKKQ